MGNKDMNKAKHKMAERIAELEEKVRMDPLKKNPKNHEELAKLKKKFA
jgi:Txe/YoeB family toxin of Txe-Axe toxin-antitoxin module